LWEQQEQPMNKSLLVETQGHDDWCDITPQVQAAVAESGVGEGLATIFVPHTTAAVTIQENADPPLRRDITEALDRVFPWHGDYGHGEDNAAAHMKVVATGPSVQVPFDKGQLMLDTWQAIYLCEFDGPRRRQVVVHIGP
jgi:secondary thiamine-phosphate synthase enzyme